MCAFSSHGVRTVLTMLAGLRRSHAPTPMDITLVVRSTPRPRHKGPRGHSAGPVTVDDASGGAWLFLAGSARYMLGGLVLSACPQHGHVQPAGLATWHIRAGTDHRAGRQGWYCASSDKRMVDGTCTLKLSWRDNFKSQFVFTPGRQLVAGAWL
jgi:hypothetical protein